MKNSIIFLVVFTPFWIFSQEQQTEVQLYSIIGVDEKIRVQELNGCRSVVETANNYNCDNGTLTYSFFFTFFEKKCIPEASSDYPDQRLLFGFRLWNGKEWYIPDNGKFIVIAEVLAEGEYINKGYEADVSNILFAGKKSSTMVFDDLEDIRAICQTIKLVAIYITEMVVVTDGEEEYFSGIVFNIPTQNGEELSTILSQILNLAGH